MSDFILIRGAIPDPSRIEAHATAPYLNPGKGMRWALLVDAPPSFDPATETRTRTIPGNVPSGDVTVEYVVSTKPAIVPPRLISIAAFNALLTSAEIDAIATSVNATVVKWRWRALTNGGVNLDAPGIATLLSGAVTLGILTQARADRILTGLPPA